MKFWYLQKEKINIASKNMNRPESAIKIKQIFIEMRKIVQNNRLKIIYYKWEKRTCSFPHSDQSLFLIFFSCLTDLFSCFLLFFATFLLYVSYWIAGDFLAFSLFFYSQKVKNRIHEQVYSVLTYSYNWF